jgi:ribosome-associated protein
MIHVTPDLVIPDEEIVFTASRSGGPGGQNVNKVSTRMTLLFDLDRSAAFRPDQRERVRSKLSARINKDGILQVTSQRTRSQEMNRADALERFVALLRDALRIERRRVATRVPAASRDRRLEEKRKRTQIKTARSRKGLDES